MTLQKIFQQLANDNFAATGISSSVSILEAQSSPVKGIQIEARSGDPSAVAGASILASLSNYRKDLTLLPPPAKAGEELQQDAEISSLTAGCVGSGDLTLDVDMKDCSNNNDQTGGPARENDITPSPDAGNENPNLDNIGLNASIDAEVGKVSGAPYELRPLLRMLAGSSSSDFDLGSISKLLDDRRESRELLKDFDRPLWISNRRQAFKDKLQQGILDSDDIEVSFESFPYYLRCGFVLSFIFLLFLNNLGYKIYQVSYIFAYFLLVAGDLFPFISF